MSGSYGDAGMLLIVATAVAIPATLTDKLSRRVAVATVDAIPVDVATMGLRLVGCPVSAATPAEDTVGRILLRAILAVVAATPGIVVGTTGRFLDDVAEAVATPALLAFRLRRRDAVAVEPATPALAAASWAPVQAT